MTVGTMMTGQGNTGAAQGDGQSGAESAEGSQAPATPAVEGQHLEGQPAAPTEAPAEGETAPAVEGERSAEGEGEKEDQNAVPEKYEFKAPEGFEGQLDEQALESFEPVARELGLSQEQADKLVNLHAQNLANHAKSQQEAWSSQVEAWQTELKQDPEFGGAKFEENVGHAQKAVRQFGGDDFIKALDETGMGNHPAFIRAFSQIGKSMSEDKLHMGGQSQGPRSHADILYPNS